MDNITELNEISVPRGKNRNGATNAVLLGPRDELKGTLHVDGDLRIEGTVEGELRASGDVDVEASATVHARLEAASISIRGTVTGDVTASKRLSVQGSGQLNGDVRTPRLRVDDGSVVNGTITMRPEGAGD
ncbi:MAG: polymer-forming cytoskeletal protein [Candidatus Dormibacteria bacterium]